MFCDPMHGGNAGLIGWQLGGYPGPQMSYRDEVDSTSGSPGGPSQPAWNRSLGGLESLGKLRRANYRAITTIPLPTISHCVRFWMPSKNSRSWPIPILHSTGEGVARR